jgi:hypothetical protein
MFYDTLVQWYLTRVGYTSVQPNLFENDVYGFDYGLLLMCDKSRLASTEL